MRIALAFLLFLSTPALAQQLCPIPLIFGPDLVTTGSGLVRGLQEDGVWSFKNMPYAAVPIGDLRWQPPQPAPCYGAIRDARTFGPACPQLEGNGSYTGNEDCLQLNVWSKRTEVLAPVMVWIHGGGHVQGSAPEEQAGIRVYDGAALTARTGMVVVTINYRLGALGYLAHPALSAEHEPSSSGNYGLLDQIAALQWVRDNIKAFGGDPSRIMIAGESAGAVSVCSLVASPLAAGLFHSAVMQSGGCSAIPRSRAEAFGMRLFEKAGCDTPACMRGLSAQDVVTALPVEADVAGFGADYGQVVDGFALPDTPVNIIVSGTHNHVPVIVGNNSDETSRAVPIVPSEAVYQALIRQQFPVPLLSEAILRLYPASEYASPRTAYIAVTSDAKFVCSGATRAAQSLLQGQAEPVHRYVLSHALENGGVLTRSFGAWHGVDVLYLFDKLEVGNYRPSANERNIAGYFADYWSSLAAGDLTIAKAQPWPRYGATEPYLNIDSQLTTGVAYRKKYCDFWDGLASLLPQ